jgi:hypothetical protein
MRVRSIENSGTSLVAKGILRTRSVVQGRWAKNADLMVNEGLIGKALLTFVTAG